MSALQLPKPLQSRKLWLAVVSAAVVFGNAYWNWGITDEQVWTFLTPILAYLGLEGAADYKAR